MTLDIQKEQPGHWFSPKLYTLKIILNPVYMSIYTAVNDDVPNWYTRITFPTKKWLQFIKPTGIGVWIVTTTEVLCILKAISSLDWRVTSIHWASLVANAFTWKKLISVDSAAETVISKLHMQNSNIPLHVNSFLSKRCNRSIELEGRMCARGSGEHNFGYYGCINAKHSCSSSLVHGDQTDMDW